MTNIKTLRTEFTGHSGEILSARLDTPTGEVKAYALFAHCFTCSKDILAAKHISQELAQQGIAVLRFDFTGLGNSEGNFTESNFSTNLLDFILASDFLRQNYQAPQILIGHSLGGAAVLASAHKIPEAKAVVTIGAPADTQHLLHHFDGVLEKIENEGMADVNLAGRNFTFQKQFIDDLKSTDITPRIKTLKKALLVMHSPIDETVGIENAAKIFDVAKHPKSFISLDQADHLLSKQADSKFAAHMVAAFASRYIETYDIENTQPAEDLIVSETGVGKFQQRVRVGRHDFFADEPVSVGGLYSGPTPFEFLKTALGACTSMTLRMYLERKGIKLGKISVKVTHEKIATEDCPTCNDYQKETFTQIDRFSRSISIDGDVSPELYEKLLEIADKCPVHKTLEQSAIIETKISN